MKIWLDETAYHLADEWSAVPADRVMGLLRIAHEKPANERSKLDALQLINPVPAKVFKKLVPWQVNELTQTLEWIWEKPFEGRPFETFEHGGVVYYTPAPNLRTTTFVEYLTAVVYLFQAYYDTDTPREVSGAHLMATLCRPMPEGTDPLDPHWSGDYREPFNEYVVEARAQLLLDLPVGILAPMVQYFVAELRWLYDHYDVFEAPAPKAATTEETEFDWQSRLMDMKDLRYVVAEERIFGTVAEVMKAPVNDVFDALERLKSREKPKRPTPQPSEPDEIDR